MTDWHPLPSLQDQQNIEQEWKEWDKEALDRAAQSEPAPMPSLDHLHFRDYEHVYEPSEDTYLLLDALQYDLSHISANYYTIDTTPSPPLCLEIGCGSGVVTVFAQTQWLKLTDAAARAEKSKTLPKLLNFVTDINPRALQVTKQTSKLNTTETASSTDSSTSPCFLELIQCDLATDLLPRLSGQCSIVIFNPPYVPTPDEEVGSQGIEAAWAGGENGRIVIDRFLPQLAQLLQKPNGVAYLVTVDDNKPSQLARLCREQYGLSMKPFFRRRARNERLTIQRITWFKEEPTICNNF